MLPLEDWSGVSRFRSWRAAQSLERRYVLQYDSTVRLMSYCNEMCVLTPFRLQFAQKCAKLITTYEFDGIDIDWEFPSTPEDMSNYSLLLFEVRQALDIIGTEAQATKSYGLTATLPCSQESLDNIDVLYLDTVLSEFNLMTIDFHGGWEPTVGANAPLYNQDGELGIASVDSCINAFVDKGASKGKINIGLPFYGRSFGGATHIGDECSSNWEGDCSDIFTWPGEHGVPQYHEIHKKLPEMTAEFDTTSKTQLAYNEHGVLSYDDERSICLKAQYAMNNRLNGFLIFDLGGDLLDDLSTPLLDAMNLKLINPKLGCDSRDFKDTLKWQEVIIESSIKKEVKPAMEVANDSTTIVEPEQTVQSFEYTCGFGEGDASARCNTSELEETTCETGQCPSGMICFLTLCNRPKPSEPQVINSFINAAGEFAKPKPKAKPLRKPQLPPGGAVAPEIVLPQNADMMFSCGLNFQHAETCGVLCPNGLEDCPPGQFCFWLECKDDPVTASLSSLTAGGPMVSKFQCGSTRDEAMTCSEECGASWQCTEGKDCYNVQCPL